MHNLSKISVAMLTKNSARYLSKCLEALRDFDEIVILDNGSSDNTLTIAVQYTNVKIVEHPFIGFGKMKNLAASYAKNDWILSIDSDEIISVELVKEIKQILLEENAVYRIYRKNYYHQKHIDACGWENDRIVRLYNREQTNFTNQPVHETIITDGFKIVDLKGALHHYSFNNITELLDKLERYTTLFAKENRFKKKTYPLTAYLKKSFHFCKDYFFRKGFLYGYEGLVIAMSHANGSFYKYMKLHEENQRLGISLIITTYNRKDALELVLLSVLNQTLLPKEVIIADDGSLEDTKALIKSYQAKFPIPLIHCWHADEGFKLAQIRNKAIAMASQEYIVMIDGDIVLHPKFIENHQSVAQKGFFIQGSRVLLAESLTKKSIQNKITHFNWWQKGLKNRFNAMHIPFLTNLLAKTNKNEKGIRGCNMAFWREDVVQVNGFNEAFVGWGREDSEFVIRLLNKGIRRKNLKFGGIAYHLYHPENDRQMLPENDKILENTIQLKAQLCEKGINQYLI